MGWLGAVWEWEVWSLGKDPRSSIFMHFLSFFSWNMPRKTSKGASECCRSAPSSSCDCSWGHCRVESSNTDTQFTRLVPNDASVLVSAVFKVMQKLLQVQWTGLEWLSSASFGMCSLDICAGGVVLVLYFGSDYSGFPPANVNSLHPECDRFSIQGRAGCVPAPGLSLESCEKPPSSGAVERWQTSQKTHTDRAHRASEHGGSEMEEWRINRVMCLDYRASSQTHLSPQTLRFEHTPPERTVIYSDETQRWLINLKELWRRREKELKLSWEEPYH